MNLLLLFIIANLLNVSLSTAKSIITIKCGALLSAIVSALYYGFYTWVLVLTMCDLGIYQKMFVVGLCNLIGVYAVKYIEEKIKKEKLWKIEISIPAFEQNSLHYDLNYKNIPHNYIENVGKSTIFNIYCYNKKQTADAKIILNTYHNAKYFVSESKNIF